MKKIIAAILCAVMMTAVSGCAFKDPTPPQQSGTESATQDATAETKAEEEEKNDSSKYDDTLDGLCKYMQKPGGYEYKDDKSYLEMDAKLIGAKEGRKFVNGNVTVELYEFDKQDGDVYKSVKENGKFQILELREVKATLSDNGKYMMIYTDKSLDKDNPDKNSDQYKNMQKAIDAFKEFHK